MGWRFRKLASPPPAVVQPSGHGSQAAPMLLLHHRTWLTSRTLGPPTPRQACLRGADQWSGLGGASSGGSWASRGVGQGWAGSAGGVGVVGGPRHSRQWFRTHRCGEHRTPGSGTAVAYHTMRWRQRWVGEPNRGTTWRRQRQGQHETSTNKAGQSVCTHVV